MLKAADRVRDYFFGDFYGKSFLMKGAALARQTLTFPEPRSYRFLFYKKL